MRRHGYVVNNRHASHLYADFHPSCPYPLDQSARIHDPSSQFVVETCRQHIRRGTRHRHSFHDGAVKLPKRGAVLIAGFSGSALYRQVRRAVNAKCQL